MTTPPLEFGTQMPLRNEGRLIGEKEKLEIVLSQVVCFDDDDDATEPNRDKRRCAIVERRV